MGGGSDRSGTDGGVVGGSSMTAIRCHSGSRNGGGNGRGGGRERGGAAAVVVVVAVVDVVLILNAVFQVAQRPGRPNPGFS